MAELLAAIHKYLAAEGKMSVRHLVYLLVTDGLIPKEEAAYKSLDHHLSLWRRSGTIKWNSFADSSPITASRSI